MKQYSYALLALFPMVLPACTNQEIYEAVRENRLQDCERQPPSAVEDCKRAFETDYETYEQMRAAGIDEGVN